MDGFDSASIPSFPNEIPCNVCSKDIALQNVYRKHADTGSWLPLERDIFVHKHMKQEKSLFLIMDEITGMISANPHLNQGFVKNEIFREDILTKFGISLADGKILSKHSPAETQAILNDISQKIKEEVITTRKNRGEVLKVLDPTSQRIIEEHKKRKFREVSIEAKNAADDGTIKPKQSRRVRTKATEIFGGKLYLRHGGVSNLYRDIDDLHTYYTDNKNSLSSTFPSLIRMALRLLCEVAAKDCNQDMEKFVKYRFQKAKDTMDQDTKTTLSNNNVTEKSIIQLLHTGAHNYTVSANMDQTLAVSIIVGAILTDSHGKAVIK